MGKDGWAAPLLKDAALSLDKLREGYMEMVIAMRTLYQKCKLVHGDLSEYNILYFEGHLYIMDIMQVCDVVEVAGRNVMSTSSTVTTGLVLQRYEEPAAKVTNEGLDAAGHVIGTAWAVFKIRKALNPKSVIKPTTLAKAASEAKSSKSMSSSSK